MQLCSYSVTADIDNMQINMLGCVPIKLKTSSMGTFLGAQLLKIHVSTVRGTGSIPGQGSRILNAAKKKWSNNESKNKMASDFANNRWKTLFIHLAMSDSLQSHGLQHTRLPCPSPTPRGYSNLCPSSRWCHPTTSFSAVTFSSCLQSFPASGSFQMSVLHIGGQSIGISASTSVLSMDTQDWSPLGWSIPEVIAISPPNLIPLCASFSPVFLMIYFAYKLNKQGDNIQPWCTPFPILEPICCSMSNSNCCFWTCMHVSQEQGKAVWYSHLFKNFLQFVVIHTVKGFHIVNETEVAVFLELSCFFYDPTDAGNLISGSSAFSQSSLNIWKFLVHILLKPNLEKSEYYFASVWDECNCAVVWTFFGIVFLWY